MSTSEGPARRVWYLDSSVALRILLGHSRAAARWFDACSGAGDAFASSRLLVLEVTRVLRRESLDVGLAHDLIDELTLLRVDDALITEAAAIRPHLKTLDALHLAAAQRIGATHATIVTHDAVMARVADTLGFDVVDPVSPE